MHRKAMRNAIRSDQKRRGRLLQALCAGLLGMGLAMPAVGGLLHVEAQACLVACGQELARCERVKGVRGLCPRDFQSCKEDCGNRDGEPALAAPERRKLLCVQRCETSASLCEQNNPRRTLPCREGAARCGERC